MRAGIHDLSLVVHLVAGALSTGRPSLRKPWSSQSDDRVGPGVEKFVDIICSFAAWTRTTPAHTPTHTHKHSQKHIHHTSSTLTVDMYIGWYRKFGVSAGMGGI